MKKRSAVSAVLLGLTTFSAGCGDGGRGDGYVDFDETAPSDLDVEHSTSDLSKTAAQPLPQEGISPVRSEGGVGSSGVTQAISQSEEPAPAHSTESQVAAEVLTPSPGDVGTAPAVTEQSPVSPEASATPEPLPSDGQQALILSTQSGLTGPVDNPVIENSASAETRTIELLIPEKHLRKERGTSAVRVTYDDLDLLKVLNMEPVPADAVRHFPEWLKSLDGKPIRIRGFMYPTYQAAGLTGFTLARDNGICCFVRQPKIYDIIGITLSDGVTTDYIEGRPFDVEGTFHIDPVADEKDLSRLYRIDKARVLH